MRRSTIQRTTKETDISVTLCLDGGEVSVSTGIGFFDHMLTALAFYAGFGLELSALGDLHVDGHHTVEDVGIVLGQALREAWACSVSYKHPSFRSEYEMRLVVSPFEREDFDVRPCYHVSQERIKKYYPLDLRSMCRSAGIGLEDLITELIIGPDSTQSMAIFQDYLRDNGLHGLVDRVSLSDCPLRTMVL